MKEVLLSLGVFLFIVTFIYLYKTYLVLIHVEGRSMLPTYKNGQTILAIRVNSKSPKIKEGKCYIYTRESEDMGEEIVVIKRLKQIVHDEEDTLCFFVGDNEAESYDSRNYGFINAEDIIARPLW